MLVYIDVGAGILFFLVGYFTILVALWLGHCWACTIGSRGCTMFDAVGTWVSGRSATGKRSGAT